MAKGLLLGNGINARIGIKGLSVSEIKERFRHNIYKYIPLLEALYGIALSEDICNNIIQSSKSDGIESLAGSFYEYIETNVGKKWTDNDETRLQQVVTCIALTSIFYNDRGKICTHFDSKKVLDVNEYDRVYTLNYIEFWDKKKECIYLHGKIDWDSFEDGENILLASKKGSYFQAYKEAIDIIGKTNNVKLIDTTDIVFAPDCIQKRDLTTVAGVYPSANLYPSADLFLYQKKELYTQLKEVEELDTFGLSPYGDENLINVMNKLKFVTVYVHNMKTNKEIGVWDKILKCPHAFKDSSETKDLTSF